MRWRTLALVYYTISVRSGPPTTQMPSGRSVGRPETALGRLQDTLARELGRDGR